MGQVVGWLELPGQSCPVVLGQGRDAGQEASEVVSRAEERAVPFRDGAAAGMSAVSSMPGVWMSSCRTSGSSLSESLRQGPSDRATTSSRTR